MNCDKDQTHQVYAYIAIVYTIFQAMKRNNSAQTS